jgi:hypothetical protein
MKLCEECWVLLLRVAVACCCCVLLLAALFSTVNPCFMFFIDDPLHFRPGPSYVCPEPIQEACTSRVTDITTCAYWSGVNCTETVIIGDNITTILDGALPNVTNITTSTKVQEYSYFSFDITNPERDVAFVVTIHDGMATLHCTVAFAWLFVVCCLLIDVLLIGVFVVCLLVLLVACCLFKGTDVDIFASQEIVNPGADSIGRVWKADEVNNVNDNREVLQICGEFG